MKVLVTGAGGLVGNEAANHYLDKGFKIVGIDNNFRRNYFGSEGDVSRNIVQLMKKSFNYEHYDLDIRDHLGIEHCIRTFLPDIIIHCAAQPSHDYSASIPKEDFNINAFSTVNLLECMRKNIRSGIFLFMSTNKVYGDNPNKICMKELDERYEYDDDNFINGIDENLSIDQCIHSPFGASKVSADIMSQEYGRYYDMNVGVFRGSCLTGKRHAGVELHGFMSYIVSCALNSKKYTIHGYKGKQVRDHIHSSDILNLFDLFIENPTKGEVYNLGGGKGNSASILETIKLIGEITGRVLDFEYDYCARKGDHVCYYTDLGKLNKTYPAWKIRMSLRDIIEEMFLKNRFDDNIERASLS